MDARIERHNVQMKLLGGQRAERSHQLQAGGQLIVFCADQANAASQQFELLVQDLQQSARASDLLRADAAKRNPVR